MCKIKEFIPCRSCPNREKGGPQQGYYYDVVGGFKVIKECECHKRWKKEAELSIKLKDSNIVPDYTFDNYRGTKSLDDLNCLKKIAENPNKFIYKKMIYLYGPNGCQKTSMVQALGKELILKGFSVQYTLMSDLINSLISDFSDNEESKDKKNYFIQKCLDCDFLIIDEAFDLSKVAIYSSGYQIPYLDSFIRNRFELNKKSIIFVSNKMPNEIASVPINRGGELTKSGFGISLQSLVERNVRESTLTFKDVYIENANIIDRHGLFK